MANKVPIDNIIREGNEAVTVMEGATVVINGFKSLLDAAVAKALENGASAEELEPLNALSTTLDEKSNALATAIANVPGSTPTPAEG